MNPQVKGYLRHFEAVQAYGWLMMNRYWTYTVRYVRHWRRSVAVVVAVVVVAWLLFVPVADWLARQDVGPARGAVLATARDAARGRLLTLGAGLLAAGALVFTARNFTLSRRTFELSEQGQVTTGTPRPSNSSALKTSSCGSAVSMPSNASPATPRGTSPP